MDPMRPERSLRDPNCVQTLGHCAPQAIGTVDFLGPVWYKRLDVLVVEVHLKLRMTA